ncbi:MAG: phosphoribosylglycinamide formyltransferase [Actinomycetota bacterium]|jgi:formyltetrahydrofolate-dependent phosphoribosylglycinamide formyltransferase
MSMRIAVLVSGNGSNLQALLDASRSGALNAEIVGVVSSRPGVLALERARSAEIEHAVVQPVEDEPRKTYDGRLRDVVSSWQPDVVVLAGFMRILSPTFLDAFAGRVINVHPALPGELPGIGAIERAYAEAQAGIRTRSGVMVHLVPDEGVDCGPILAAVEVPMVASETLETFANRMHAAEHQLLVGAVTDFITRLTSTQGVSP